MLYIGHDRQSQGCDAEPRKRGGRRERDTALVGRPKT